MDIRRADADDVEAVAKLEKIIDGKYAATKKTLLARLKMFPEGFLLAEDNGAIVGYIESCLWNRTGFTNYEEIEDFPKNHCATGKYLYVIFLGVSPDSRRRGIGSQLINEIVMLAKKKHLLQVQLVAEEGFLPDFYKKLGFRKDRFLPGFFSNSSGTVMLMDM